MATVKTKCLNCGKEFEVLRYRKNEAKFCCHKCYAENLKGKKTKPCSEEKKKKISLANSGEKNGMYGKTSWNKAGRYIKCKLCNKEFWVQPNEEKKGKKFCSQECSLTYQFKDSYKQRFKIICKQCGKEFEVLKNEKNKRKYCSIECFNIGSIGREPWNKGKHFPQISGEKCHFWKGGGRFFVGQIRKILEYNNWRLQVYERDDFKCQIPGCDNPKRKINAHHIVQFLYMINKNNIKSIEEAQNCQELWDINNGITLCEKCHRKIRGKEKKYAPLFNEIIKIKNI
jgi:5-methylcytosine-specific restriction endonuclease McrA